MAEGFDDINAPQFFDFNVDLRNLDDSADTYFEQTNEDPLNNSDFTNDVTMLASEFGEMQFSEGNKKFRKSMSVGNLHNMLEHVHKLRDGKQYTYEDETGHNGSSITQENDYSTQSSSHEAGPSVYYGGGSQEFIDRLAQPKRKFKSDQELNKNEYVPMAEALRKFQNGTPKRFRTKPKALAKEPLKATIPHSPKLKTSARSRPLHLPSHEELEQLALDEARRSQFKAQPLNKRILQAPNSSSSKTKKKMWTIPEPFKLTEVHSKRVVPDSPQKVQEFHARPVPKCIYDSRQPVIKPHLKIPLTTPQTPTFVKKSSNTSINIVQNKNLPVDNSKLSLTKTKPFSFELRDKYMKSKREALVQKYVEAEKKARAFHARPVPKAVIEASNKAYSASNGSLSNGRVNSEDNINCTNFKAKPPNVLYKKPFVPLLPNRPLLEIVDFTLNTDQRAKERENFEHQMKEKEEKLTLLRQEEEIIKKRQDEEEIMKARKLAKFKAQEIKKYKEVKIQPVKKVTNPVSPKFCSNRLRNCSGNKENTE